MLKRQPAFSLKKLVISIGFTSCAFFASPIFAAASDLGEEVLSTGVENSQVEELQELLYERGILEQEHITGIFDEETKEAVKAFQTKHHIDPNDGIAGPYTIGALQVLEEGDEGKPVELLQQKLNELGYYRDNIDGIFGTDTHHAVVDFQQQADIRVDGLVGPETISTLLGAGEELKKKASEETVAVAEPEENVASSSTTLEQAVSSQEGRKLTVSATAYTANCAGCSGVTATGVNLHANPNAKVIAVDPNVIPLGSKVHVEGYGTFTAADTGGAIKGNKIDIFMPNKQEAIQFGRRNLEVTVLN